MEKQFKYKVAYNCSSQEEFDNISEELRKLGYLLHGGNYSTTYSHIVTNYAGRSSNLYGASIKQNTAFQDTLCDSRELFIALASQVDSEEFFEGEYVIRTNDTHCGMRVGDIDKITKVNYQDSIILTKYSPDGIGGHMGSKLRKANQEEIIQFINSQKKVETIKEEKQMKKKSVSVEGNKYLLQALVNELLEAGLEITNEDCSSLNLPTNLSTENNILWWSSSKKDTHYILPQDYNEAKQAFIDYYKEEELIEGKWYKSTRIDNGNTALFIYNSDESLTVGFGYAGAWTNNVSHKDCSKYKLIPATEEEIKAALVAYAKTKYPVGTKVKSLAMPFEGTVSHKIKNTFSTSELWFESQDGNYNYQVYDNGKWAEILPSIPVINIKGYEAKFYKETVAFGCQSIKLSTIKDIVRIQKELGVDLTKNASKIQEIVDYYKTNPKLGDPLPF